MGHQHTHHVAPGHRHAFRLTVLLNAGLCALQLMVGLAFGSIALVGDALHNLGDVAGLLLGWGAEVLNRQPAQGRFSYGYGRATQLAALANAMLILVAAVSICIEAISRFSQPEPLIAGPVAWAALAGLVVNLASARLFSGGHRQDLNRRGAVLHLLSDAAASAAVLLSTLLITLTDWIWLDPFTGLLVGLGVGWMGFTLLRASLSECLDAAPTHINLAHVRTTLETLAGVESVHHLHVWALSTSRVALSAHLVCDADCRSHDPLVMETARERLLALGIDHTTLQLESSAYPCGEGVCGASEATDQR